MKMRFFFLCTVLIFTSLFAPFQKVNTAHAEEELSPCSEEITDVQEQIHQLKEMILKDEDLRETDYTAKLIGDFSEMLRTYNLYLSYHYYDWGKNYYDSWMENYYLQVGAINKSVVNLQTCLGGLTADQLAQLSEQLNELNTQVVSILNESIGSALKDKVTGKDTLFDETSDFWKKVKEKANDPSKVVDIIDEFKLKQSDITASIFSSLLTKFAHDEIYTEDLNLTDDEREACSSSFSGLLTSSSALDKATSITGSVDCSTKLITKGIGSVEEEQQATHSFNNASLIYSDDSNERNKVYDELSIYTLLEKKYEQAVVLRANYRSAYLNGSKTYMDVTKPSLVPIDKNGELLIPVDFAQKLYKNGWSFDDTINKATITQGDKVVELTLDEPTMNVNGSSVTLTEPMQKIDDVVYLPLFSISRELGKQINVENSNIVTITDQPVSLTNDEAEMLANAFERHQ